jgi:hypothetical protein
VKAKYLRIVLREGRAHTGQRLLQSHTLVIWLLHSLSHSYGCFTHCHTHMVASLIVTLTWLLHSSYGCFTHCHCLSLTLSSYGCFTHCHTHMVASLIVTLIWLLHSLSHSHGCFTHHMVASLIVIVSVSHSRHMVTSLIADSCPILDPAVHGDQYFSTAPCWAGGWK